MKHDIKILVIDDNTKFIAAFRTMLIELLGSDICQITCANDGFEAIEILRNSTFDYIFIDIFMPIIEGIEILKIFFREYYRRYTVLVVVSTCSDPEYIKRAMNTGARYILLKDKIDKKSLANILNLDISD